ncbi:MerR family transcriptional regulator [Halalkalibacter flavus]|uniref:MerR family transcriptional regulator n=1 Tax=Halalkalibacter flavus TaxID=3090668 RepID=UPI002FCC8FC6
MEIAWITVADIHKETNIPESTIRRYIKNYAEYFKTKKVGRAIKYSDDAIEIILYIAALFNDKYSSEEVAEKLQNKYAMTINVEEKPKRHEVTTDPPAEKDNELVMKLMQTIMEMETRIRELENDQRQLAASVSPEEERQEKLNYALLQNKINRQLEEEAEKEWQLLPEQERYKKRGWFSKELDFEKKQKYIKHYIDKHYEQKLRQELGME